MIVTLTVQIVTDDRPQASKHIAEQVRRALGLWFRPDQVTIQQATDDDARIVGTP